MRILHIHPSLQSGGIEAMICALSNEMIKRNEVSFCSIFETKESHTFLKKLDKNIKIFSLHKTKPGIQIKMLWSIYKFIKKRNYDIVHIHGFFYYYIIAIFLLHKQCHFFYTIHSDANMENTLWDKKLFLLKKFFFNKNWMTPITISKASKSSFDTLYKMDSKLIYNGTTLSSVKPYNLSQYKITLNTKILFHPGRITLAKNQEMLCENCQKLIDEKYDIVLLIAGLNQDTHIFNRLSKYWSNRIIYLGDRNDVINIMANADAFCLSSIWEGMPVTLLEALSVGCIPICTPVGGIPEVINNEISGFLSKSNTKEDYYLALKQYLNTPKDKLDKIKTTVKKNFERFDIANTSILYEDFYKSKLPK